MNEIKAVGEIILREEQFNDKDKSIKYLFKKKIKFNKEDFYVAVKAEDKNLQKFFEEVIYFALYAKMMNAERAYFYNEEKKEVLLLDGFDDTYFVNIATIDNNDSPLDIAERHYAGSSSYEIEETLKEIKKEYASNDITQILALIFVLLGVFGMAYYVFFDTEKDVTPPPSPPPPMPKKLDEIETMNLKRVASINLITNIENEVLSIIEDKNLIDKRHITEYSTKNYSTIPISKPIQSRNGTWYFPKNKPKRGGIELKGQVTYEQNFASVDYKFISKDTYANTKSFNFIFTEDNLTKEIPILTKNCLMTPFFISNSKNIYVIERKNNKIKINFNNINASTIIKKIKPFLEKCPAYLENFNLINSKASGKLILFRPYGGKNEI